MEWRAIVFGFLARWGMETLIVIAQAAWDALWKEAIDAIGQAELIYHQKYSGKDKKSYVLDSAMYWLEKRGSINKWNKFIIKLAIGQVIDYLVREIHKELGKSWTARARDLKQVLADKIPRIN
jgi:hypothetical protein